MTLPDTVSPSPQLKSPDDLVICLYCQKLFAPTRPFQVYCCAQCGAKYRYQINREQRLKYQHEWVAQNRKHNKGDHKPRKKRIPRQTLEQELTFYRNVVVALTEQIALLTTKIDALQHHAPHPITPPPMPRMDEDSTPSSKDADTTQQMAASLASFWDD